MLARGMVIGGVGPLLVLTGCSQTTPAPSVAPTKDAADLSSPEATEILADCVRAKGWEVVGGRTSITYAGLPEQNDAFQAELNQCYKELGFADVKPPDYTPEYLAKKYEQEQDTRTCLIGQRQDIPELPSLQAYSDMFFGEGRIYSSYEFVAANQYAADELRAICGDPLESWGTEIDR